MIVKNDREQYLLCTLCGETTELSRSFLANPEAVFIKMEVLRDDHKECQQYAHDPRRAAMQRGYKVRMRAETEQTSRRTKARAAR